jgi:hypothetical protein
MRYATGLADYIQQEIQDGWRDEPYGFEGCSGTISAEE